MNNISLFICYCIDILLYSFIFLPIIHESIHFIVAKMFNFKNVKLSPYNVRLQYAPNFISYREVAIACASPYIPCFILTFLVLFCVREFFLNNVFITLVISLILNNVSNKDLEGILNHLRFFKNHRKYLKSVK